jgi:hypothetical protein
MYIPTTFFSTQASCFEVTTTAGDGKVTTGSFVSGGVFWDYYQFETFDIDNPSFSSITASLNILSGSTNQAKILIVGGGGTGANSSGTVRPINNDFNYTVTSAGGGGGGGVVYYDNFPLISGSYEIGVGGAVSGQILCPGCETGVICGKIGNSSYLKLPNNTIYTPFTSSTLLAYGGGGGGTQGMYIQVSPRDAFFANVPVNGFVTQSFASAGGAAGTTGFLGSPLRTSPGNSNYFIAGGADMGGLNGADQGANGGRWCGGTDGGVGYTQGGGPGGGGAGGGAGNLGVNCGNVNTYVTNGGNGATYNLNGTNLIVGNGGGGANANVSLATGRGVRGSSAISTYGSGGNGQRAGSTDNIGNGGVVIIAIPRCESAFSCREFNITGNGGVATFLECGKTTTTSTTLSSGFDIVACLKTFSGSITPVLATGATYVALSSSCDTAFTSSNSGCTNCNTYTITSDSNKIAKVDYTPCNESTTSTTYVAGTYNLCVSGSGISVATGSASSLGTQCSVIGCDITPSNDNTPPCPCQSLFVNVFSGRYDFTYTDCNGVTQTRSSSASPFCGVPGSIRGGSCAFGSCIGLQIRQGGTCCTYP